MAPGLGAQLGADDRAPAVRCSRRQRQRRVGGAGRRQQQLAGLGQPPADDDHLRVEQVLQVGDAQRHPPGELRPAPRAPRRRRRPRPRVTCSPRTASGSPPARATTRVGQPGLGRIAGQSAQPAARGEALPAAPPPARARRAVRVDHHVARLAGEPGRPPQQRGRRRSPPPPMPVPSVTSTTSDAPTAGPGAVLGHRRAVGVVVDHHRAARWRSATAAATSRSTTPGRLGANCSTPSRSTSPAMPTPTAAPAAADRPRRAGGRGRPRPRRAPPAMAVRAPRRVGSVRRQRLARVGGVEHPTQDLGAADVEAGDQPASAVGATRSVPQQGADAPHHVEVGVVDADLDVARLGQGHLDRLLDDVVDRPQLAAAASGSAVRPDPGGRSRRQRQPASV